jgi:hypothetical protein
MRGVDVLSDRPCRRKRMARKKSTKDRDHLQTLIGEATVDCYDEIEERVGMMTTVADRIVCPFNAKVIGETVEVTSLEGPGKGLGVMAVCRYKGKEYRIDIGSLEWPKQRSKGFEWFEAYREWRKGHG